MSLSDLVGTVAALVAAASLVVGVLTYVYSIALRPDLLLSVGQDIYLWYQHDDRLLLCADLAFINRGAQPAALIEVSATLSGPALANDLILHWATFEETYFTGDVGQPTQRHTRSSGLVETLIVPGRMSGSPGVARAVRLLQAGDGERPALRAGGTYRLRLSALENSARPRLTTYSCDLTLDEDGARWLAAHLEDEDGAWYDRLRLIRDPIAPAGSAPGRSRSVDTFRSHGLPPEPDNRPPQGAAIVE